MSKERIASCKVCGDISVKVEVPKTPSGFVGHISEENGKRWQGLVCYKCLPEYRKTKYRTGKDYPEQECPGCGIQFKPSRSDSKACSPKCTARVKRGESRIEYQKQIPVKLKLKI